MLDVAKAGAFPPKPTVSELIWIMIAAIFVPAVLSIISWNPVREQALRNEDHCRVE
jgi:hypothetical protein